ncbi:MAG TPA: shikimate dehydrogenase [Candidatus Polarisedimenticolia bacterium]|nr:shikimate dehydrogenase [Candidatus Polarisedimenticolia bacterium]
MRSRALVIQVVACETTEKARSAYLAADRRADLVEIRLDLIKDLQPDRILAAKGKPKLITVRSREQGGAARAADREALLRRSLAARVEYLDLELGDQDLPALLRRGRTRRILSYHDLNTTPGDLEAIHARMRSVAGGALVKIVTYADAATDNLRVRDLLRSSEARNLIAFCMGPKGVPSRILASHWGSAAVYAPARGATPSAPGQVSLEDLLDLYRADTIDHDTRLLGVVGSPIGHSLSPLIHNRALAALGLNYRYLPFEATTLGEFLPLMSELRVSGLSVTLPHKEKFLPYLESLDETARAVGAVNTVVKTWNRLEGHNTDVEAALAPLRSRITLAGSRVAVLGAGGAARALLHGLTTAGARVTLFNRTPGRGRDLARRFGARALPWGRLRRFPCDLLVNATSVGLTPHTDESPIPASWVAAPMVYDIIYNPPETRLLREARRRGAATIGGVEMFVAQGAAQFRLFTGHEAPVDLMRQAVLEALGESAPAPPRSSNRRPGTRRSPR